MRVPLPPRSSHPRQGLGLTSAVSLTSEARGGGWTRVQVLQAGNGRTDCPRLTGQGLRHLCVQGHEPKSSAHGGRWLPSDPAEPLRLAASRPSHGPKHGNPTLHASKTHCCELVPSKSFTEKNYRRASVSVPEAGRAWGREEDCIALTGGLCGGCAGAPGALGGVGGGREEATSACRAVFLVHWRKNSPPDWEPPEASRPFPVAGRSCHQGSWSWPPQEGRPVAFPSLPSFPASCLGAGRQQACWSRSGLNPGAAARLEPQERGDPFRDPSPGGGGEPKEGCASADVTCPEARRAVFPPCTRSLFIPSLS